jgi:hypothetical protein
MQYSDEIERVKMSTNVDDEDPFARYRRSRAIEVDEPEANDAARWIFSGLLALALFCQTGTQVNLWGQGVSTFATLSLLTWKAAWLLELTAFLTTAVAFGLAVADRGRQGAIFALVALCASVFAVLMFIIGDITNEVPFLDSLKGEILGLTRDSGGSTVFYPAVLLSGPVAWAFLASGLLVHRNGQGNR